MKAINKVMKTKGMISNKFTEMDKKMGLEKIPMMEYESKKPAKTKKKKK